MLVWRLSRFDSAAKTFDGQGARLYAGRWHEEGTPVVYTSEHLSLAALELFVNVDPGQARQTFHAFSAELPDELLEIFPSEQLPAPWAPTDTPTAARAFGSEWARSGRSLALVVPSVIIRRERNIIINPRHPEFPKVHIQGPEPFAFDPRMLGSPRH